MRFFYSTAPRSEPNYTFGGDFGGSLQGLGVGLKLALIEAQVWGGDLILRPAPQQQEGEQHRGLEVKVILPGVDE